MNPSDNFFRIPEKISSGFELFETLISNDKIAIEKIISTGQKTPEGQWLEDDRDEWVMLLQGESELLFADGKRMLMKPGDYLMIKKNIKHRVEMTSADPACIWLAVYY